MRRRLLAATALACVVAGCLYWHRTELRIRYLRSQFPVGHVPLEKGEPPYLGHAIVTGGAIVGTASIGSIQLGTGEPVHYWFMSHHQSGDFGGTVFQLPSGGVRFVEGYFCCEVQFPDGSVLRDEATLQTALDAMDGRSP